MNARDQRIGANEAIFRAFNEGIREVVDKVGASGKIEFVCECGRADCTAPIRLTEEEYAAVRSDRTTFVVRKGHELGEVEHVTRELDGHLVVAKHQGDPAARD